MRTIQEKKKVTERSRGQKSQGWVIRIEGSGRGTREVVHHKLGQRASRQTSREPDIIGVVAVVRSVRE